MECSWSLDIRNVVKITIPLIVWCASLASIHACRWLRMDTLPGQRGKHEEGQLAGTCDYLEKINAL